VLFGDSTLALRQWMRENAIAFEMQQNEPEDHFGTLLLLAAWLAENGREGVRSASGVAPAAVEHPLPVVFVDAPGIRFIPRWVKLAADARGLAIRAPYSGCGKDAVSQGVACSG
jgi:hypothetical protein